MEHWTLLAVEDIFFFPGLYLKWQWKSHELVPFAAFCLIKTSIYTGGIPTPVKNDGVKVSWDDDIPNMMGKS